MLRASVDIGNSGAADPAQHPRDTAAYYGSFGGPNM